MTNDDAPCIWCGSLGKHKHFAILVREKGKLLGRLCPDGSTTTRKPFAAVLSKEKADRIADEINNGQNTMVPSLTAKVIPF